MRKPSRDKARLLPLLLPLLVLACASSQDPVAPPPAPPPPPPPPAAPSIAPPPASTTASATASAPPPAASSAPPPAASSAPVVATPPTVKIANATKSQAAQELVNATMDVLRSPPFQAHFLASGPMRDKAEKGHDRPAQEVFDAYFGTDTSSGKPGPVAAFLVMAGKGREACPKADSSGISGVAVTRLRDCGKDATIHIQSYVLDRWHSGGAQGFSESKACAINTIAHEMAHLAIQDVAGAAPNKFQDQLYQDKGHRDPDFDKKIHLASYTIGSLAQCTYMQEHGLIGPESSVFDECLRTTMTTDFHASPACQSHDKKRW